MRHYYACFLHLAKVSQTEAVHKEEFCLHFCGASSLTTFYLIYNKKFSTFMAMWMT